MRTNKHSEAHSEWKDLRDKDLSIVLMEDSISWDSISDEQKRLLDAEIDEMYQNIYGEVDAR